LIKILYYSSAFILLINLSKIKIVVSVWISALRYDMRGKIAIGLLFSAAILVIAMLPVSHSLFFGNIYVGPNSNIITAVPQSPTELYGFIPTPTQINLTWVDNSNNEKGFIVYRASDATFADFIIFNLDPDVTSFIDSEVDPAIPHCYEVVAFNDAGYSVPSDILTISDAGITASSPDVPGAPDRFFFTLESTSEVKLFWLDNSYIEDGFVLQRSSSFDFSTDLVTHKLPRDTQAYTDDSIETDRVYYYEVAAFNSVGYSWPTDTLTVSTVMSPPDNLEGVPTDTTVKLSWKIVTPDENHFELWRKLGQDGTWFQVSQPASGVTSYTDTGLIPGTVYYYRILSVFTYGVSEYSGEIMVTTTGTAPPVSSTGTTESVAPSSTKGLNNVLTLGGGLVSQSDIRLDANGITLSDASVLSGDGTLTINIARGTKASDSSGQTPSLKILPISDFPPLSQGVTVITSFNLGPDSTTFNRSISISVKIDGLSQIRARNTVYISQWNGSQWDSLSTEINLTAGILSAQITRLSIIAAFAVPLPLTPSSVPSLTTAFPVPSSTSLNSTVLPSTTASSLTSSLTSTRTYTPTLTTTITVSTPPSLPSTVTLTSTVTASQIVTLPAQDIPHVTTTNLTGPLKSTAVVNPLNWNLIIRVSLAAAGGIVVVLFLVMLVKRFTERD
jgi:hypothetical protein